MIFWRVIRGEESVGTAFVVSFLVLMGYHAYDHFVPSFSDFFTNWFRSVHLMILLYISASMHNSCRSSGFALRMLVRAYVVLVTFYGMYLAYQYFNIWIVVAYLIATLLTPFLFRE